MSPRRPPRLRTERFAPAPAWLAGALLLASLIAAPCGAAEAWQSRVPAPRDVAYPGRIVLQVDVSDIQRRIFEVRERIPVRPGSLTLLYPQWLPGNHAPRGPIEQVAGLVIQARGGQRLAWQRDPLDVYAVNVQVPAGTTELEMAFQLASPQASDQGRVLVTTQLLGLQWNAVLFYPAGHYASRIELAPQVKLPSGWEFATALEVERRDGDTVVFRPQPLDVLADSPLFAGRNHKELDLSTGSGAPGNGAPVRLQVFAEDAANLTVKPEQLAAHKRLVAEAYAALGPPRFDHYDLLLALSDTFGGVGLEHLRSSENSQHPEYFTDWDADVGGRDLLAHEFTHSWNGKYRRPARLWTPNYNVPMQDNLLWVYEGMTEYWGMVLTARAGLWSAEFARETLATIAAVYDRKRAGRAWRPLEDTTHQPITAARRPLSWQSWQRSEDYYDEGLLVWLDVDSKLRELTSGRVSLDDFARTFFAAPADRARVSTYERGDLVRGLQALAPFDWSAFLKERVEDVAPRAPLAGFERSGWRLVYNDKPSDYIKDVEKDRKITDLSYSLGFVVSRDAELAEVVWGSPAFESGLTRGTTLVAVNGVAYSAERLKDAIKAAKDGAPLELLVKKQDHFRTVRIDYRGGLQYPHLERIPNTPDRLADVLKPRA